MGNAQLDRFELQGANFGIDVAADAGMRDAAQRTPYRDVTFGHDLGSWVDVTDYDKMSLVADRLS